MTRSWMRLQDTASSEADLGFANSFDRSSSLRRICFAIAFVIVQGLGLNLIAVGTHAQQVNAARQSEFAEFAMAHPGSSENGKRVYDNVQKTACSNCHAINGIEKSGPNLDGIADKYPRKDLIHHILDPNAFIQPGYETATVLTTNGEVVAGRIRLSTRLEVRLLLATGKLRSIKRDQIEDIKSKGVSMMPTDLVNSITRQEFADLIAYLETLKSSELDAWQASDETISATKIETPIELSPIHGPNLRFENPVWLTEIPDQPGQLIVLEHQQGRAVRLDTTTVPPTRNVFLDISNEITFSPNQGLMCLVFHPEYASNGKYYVKYEVKSVAGEVLTTVNERHANESRLADSGQDSRRLLSQRQPAFNHNGGCLAFGPDGMLYIAFGDGGPQKDPPGYSQNPRIFHGSLLRIDVDHSEAGRPYSIPSDNPFVKSQQKDPAFKKETWAFGFREPWRFSFDSVTGDLWLGDVGQVKYEEVCLVRRGQNHGWNVREGFVPFSQQYLRPGEEYTDPVLAYPRSMGVSVTGGYVYRGREASPFYGDYIFGDYESRKIWALRHEDGQATRLEEIATSQEHIASFGVDRAGELYVVGYEGTIFHLVL